jgi:hypothetical protein
LAKLERKSRKSDRLPQGGSRAKASRVGDDLVAAFEEMAQHLRGEIELEAHDPAVSDAASRRHFVFELWPSVQIRSGAVQQTSRTPSG